VLSVPELAGDLVRLEPLGHRHAPDLAAAAEEDRSDLAVFSIVAGEWPARRG